MEPEIVEAYRAIPVAAVSDSMHRLNGLGTPLVRMHREGQLCGPALPVKTRPGDNLMLHKAIEMAEPGDVIVCDAGGDVTNSLMGEMMLVHAHKRDVGGFVIDGAIRDRDAFTRVNLPVYARGVAHRGPYRDGPGEIGFAIAIGGMPVEAGDLIVGDADGLVVVPRAAVYGVLDRARAKVMAEEKQLQTIMAGKFDRSWIDETLSRRGCAFID